MLHHKANPVVLVGSNNRVVRGIGCVSNAQDDSENLIELQADWLVQRYPISRDHARLVAGLYFGETA